MITCCTPSNLHDRSHGSEKTFFIRVKDGHPSNLRKIKPFAQKINANQNVKLAKTQIA